MEIQECGLLKLMSNILGVVRESQIWLRSKWSTPFIVNRTKEFQTFSTGVFQRLCS